MILYEIFGTEHHVAYQRLQVSNISRQYDFLKSIVETGLEVNADFLSTAVIKALNYHAITCLHVNAGEFRPCPVSVGEYIPPAHYQVQARMDFFVNLVNRRWDAFDPVVAAAFVLWQLNHIHPFINGNGRTARAACYFVLCLKLGRWLPGTTLLPELISQNRQEYVLALREADSTGDLQPLADMLARLLAQQVGATPPDDAAVSLEGETPNADSDDAPPDSDEPPADSDDPA